MDEQWCAHAVALLLRAHELDFFHQRSGFPSVESTYQIATSSSEDIAAALRAATEIQEIPASSTRPAEVEIALNTSSDRLGIKLWINKRLHTPSLFESIQDLSDRALDRLLLEAIEDEGRWDESQEIWYINSSHSIELVLGLISEYPQVSDWPNRKKLKFSSEPLTAQVLLEWLPGAAHLRLEWILPSGQRIEKQESVLGTGPYWTVVEKTIYRLTAAAARVAILFPYGPKLTLQRSQLGPLLETIRDRAIDQELLIVLNPEQQPEAIVKTPQPQIQLERPDAATEHFTSHRDIELRATVEFHYPTPSSDSNVVYLPNRRKEREHLEQLRALGLQPLERSRHYSIKGDIALDLLEKGDNFFPARWQVQGLKTVRRGLRFARLTLSVVLRTISNNSSTQSGTDHFDCSISLAQNNAHIPLSSLFKSQEVTNTDRWIRLEGGAYARIPGGSLNQLKSLLESVDPEYRMSNSIHTQLTAPQAISFARLSSADLQVTTDRKLQNIVHKLQDFEGIKRIKTTRGFTGELRPYQADGLSWLNFLHSFELDGILADEMGLGKTVQTLAMLQYLRDSRARNKEFTKPDLVVASTSVTMNWFYEAQRFAPQLKAIVLQGPQRRKYLDDLDNYQLIITSYALLRVDRFELAQYEYSYVILDEAQHIKNPTTATSKAAKALRAQRRLALSGTPTENRPLELWSIFDFLMPGYLGSREFFRSHIERPIIEEGTNVAAVHYLSAKTRPFILRRIKADVERDLPPKTESELHVSMADSQAALYNEILNEV
ncbi:MAG: SNF2-related protein, partial [Candidatus Cloacimonetes bacterium]|nr:SNF2-related protein [Candidatus Cloacimonadota bacterium]